MHFGREGSAPVEALERAMQRDVIAISDDIEAEIANTLIQKFTWPERRAHEALRLVLRRSVRYKLQHTVHLCRDPKDNMFLECAALAQANVLVSGDKDLLILRSYAGTLIVTALEYLALEQSI